jgi:hypothetical protein
MLLFVKIAVGIAALYLSVVVLMALAQDRLLFPRWAVARGPALPATVERFTLGLASGDELVGVHLPAEKRSPPGAALLLGFGGKILQPGPLADEPDLGGATIERTFEHDDPTALLFEDADHDGLVLVGVPPHTIDLI